MNLFERDYTKIITSEDKEALLLEKEWDMTGGFDGTRNIDNWPTLSHPNIECRKFLERHQSIYPNNYLGLFCHETFDMLKEAKEYESIIYNNGDEKTIQAYIKTNRKWFIPASIFIGYGMLPGYYLFPEMKLGAEYIVDYMLLAPHSADYHIIFVEFENANTKFLLDSSNSESESVRKGIAQLRDWKQWIEDNRDYFHQSTGLKDRNISIPLTNIFYCLVVSRRDKMSKRARDVRSRLCYEMSNTKIITFDRLADNIRYFSLNNL